MLVELLTAFYSIFLKKRKKEEKSNWWNDIITEKEAEKVSKIVEEEPPKIEKPVWMYPVKIQRVTSPYGWRKILGKRRWHNGTDFTGYNKYAMVPTDGIVTKILKPDYKYPVRFRYINKLKRFVSIKGIPKGRCWTPYIIVQCSYDKNIRFIFRHVDATVKIGQKLEAGDNVGKIGNLGYSMGAHLHFEVSLFKPKKKKWVNTNPVTFLNKKIKKEQSGKL